MHPIGCEEPCREHGRVVCCGMVRRGGAAKWGKASTYAAYGTIQFQVQAQRGKPGPGQYEVTKDANIGGGRFNRGNAKSGMTRKDSAWDKILEERKDS